MLRITKTALNQGLRSETVRASSELTQLSSSLRVPNTLQDDALTSSSRNQLKIKVPCMLLAVLVSRLYNCLARMRVT